MHSNVSRFQGSYLACTLWFLFVAWLQDSMWSHYPLNNRNRCNLPSPWWAWGWEEAAAVTCADRLRGAGSGRALLSAFSKKSCLLVHFCCGFLFYYLEYQFARKVRALRWECLFALEQSSLLLFVACRGEAQQRARDSRACLGSGKFMCQGMKDAAGEMSLMYFEAKEELAELRFQASDLLSDWNSHILSEVFVARAKVFPCLHIVLWNMYWFCMSLSPSVVQFPTLFCVLFHGFFWSCWIVIESLMGQLNFNKVWL